MAAHRWTCRTLGCAMLCHALVENTVLIAHATSRTAIDARASRQLRGESQARSESIDAGKFAELQGKVTAAYQAVADMETSMRNVQAQLMDAEQTFAGVTRHVAQAQHVALNLSVLAASNRLQVRNVTNSAFHLLLKARALSIDVNYTSQSANRSAQNVSAVATDTDRLLSLGQFQGRNGGCMDAPEPETKGEKVQMWTCLKAQPSQQWKFDPAGKTISHLHGICLAAPPGQNAVVMWDCDATQESQQWSYDAASGLVRSKSGKCLSAENQAAKGSIISMQDCNANSQGQQWNVIIGGDALRQKLDSMNKELWAMADENNDESLDMKEKGLDELESETDELEASLDKQSQQTLVSDALLKRVSGLRRALHRLVASSEVSAARASPQAPCATGPRSLADDLGLEE